MKRRKVPTEAITSNCPVKLMDKVKNVKTTEYQMGLIERPPTLDEWFPTLTPIHLCIMRTRDNHTHIFIWED